MGTLRKSTDTDRPGGLGELGHERSSTFGNEASTKPKTSAPTPTRGPVAHLKVFYLENDSFTPISTIPAPWSTSKDKGNVKLQDLRKLLKDFVQSDYGFCLHDKSYMPDETSIEEYLQHSAKQESETGKENSQSESSSLDVYSTVYIKDQVRKLNPNAIINGQFILKVIDKGSTTEEHSSVHSSQLSEHTSPLTLAMIRPHIKLAGPENTAFEFCFEDKTKAHDSILLETYIGKAANLNESHAALPVIPVYVQKTPRTKNEILNGNFLIRFVKKGDKGTENDGDTGEGSVQSHELGSTSALCLYHLRAYVRSMSANSKRHEFCMADGTSLSDSTKLETYISTEPKKEDSESELPIFTVYFQKVASKPWFGGASQEMKDNTKVDTKPNLGFGDGVKDPLTAGGMRDRAANMSEMGISEEFLKSLAVQLPSKITYPSELDENQWEAVLHNCNVFYGWKFDLSTLTISRAPYAAFKLRKNLNMPTPEEPRILPQASNSGNPEVQDQTQNTAEASKEGGEGAGEGQTGEEKTNPEPRIRKANALPTFRVSDDSRVDVSVVTSKMQESMARNNFTAKSFEVGVAGSIKGVDIGVSGGKSERKEQSEGSVTTRTDNVMIGNYRFPRVELLLRSSDLEPTEELVAAIKEVKLTRSLERLQALHEKFGHLFCEDVVLGGCLQTTRVTKGDDTVTESSMKSQFKAEVGAAVSAPKIASINAKYSTEKGNEESKGKQATHVSDNIVFEATGGNTVLATDPPSWIASILEHQNWRVIERGNLKPLANVLAECALPEVRGVRQWFVQAVPVLSQYINVPASRSLSVRFRVMPQIPEQLSLFPDLSKSFYLGHQDQRPVHPIRISLQRRYTEVHESYQQRQVADLGGVKSVADWAGKILPFHPLARIGSAVGRRLPNGVNAVDITREHIEKRATEEIALFTPAKAQAPVLLQYDDTFKNSGINLAIHDESVWEMIVPHDDMLKNNTQVMLRTRAGNQNRYLTVYRTFQGSFMPGITSDEGASIWRLVRDKTMRPDAKDEFFQEGDLVRLSWSFADQTAGFRNFQLDTFGRRCYQKPIDVKTPTLYFKLPFPGFGNTTRTDSSDTSGQAMVMNGEGSQLPFLTPIVVNGIGNEGLLKPIVYNLHDLSFRLDVISNNGRGELLDYMTYALSQKDREIVEKELSRHTEKISPMKDALESGVDDVGRALMGPMYNVVSGPAKSIVRGVFGGLLNF